MAISLLYNPFPMRLFEADGDFAAGGKAFFYLARTSTPLAVYTDSPLAVPHPWPVVADGYGLLPPIYLPIGTEYKVRIEDALGSLLYAADGIDNSGGGGGSLPVDSYSKAQSDASFVNVDGDVMTGNLTIDKASPTLVINKPAAETHSAVLGQLDGKARWLVSLGDATAESGANAGSDFGIHGYTDAGAYLSTPLSINRANGGVTIPANLTAGGELKTNSGVLRLSADATQYLHGAGAGTYYLGGAGHIWHAGNFAPSAYAPIGGVSGNWIVGSTTYFTNGDIYMPWAGNYLSNVLAGKADAHTLSHGGQFTVYANNSGYAIYGTNASSAGGGVIGLTSYNGLYGICAYAGYSFYSNGGAYIADDVDMRALHTRGIIYSIGSMNSTTASSPNVWQNSSAGNYARVTSSLNYKTAIEPIWDSIGDKILDLKPIFYRSNELTIDNPGYSWYSFAAEDVAALDPRFAQWGREVKRDAEGKPIPVYAKEHTDPITGEPVDVMKGYELEEAETPNGLNLNALVSALVNLVQRQEERIRALEGAGQ